MNFHTFYKFAFLRITIALLIILAPSSFILSQLTIPVIKWEKSLGGYYNDLAYSTCISADGGFVVAGTSNSEDNHVIGNHGYYDFWISKLSSTGTIVWKKAYGGSQEDIPNKIIKTSDNGFLVVGNTDSDDGNITVHHGTVSYSDFWIVKLTSAGNMSWQKSFGGTQDDFANSVIQTNDGGYIVVGTSRSTDGDLGNGSFDFNATSDIWVVKLSSSGSIEWQKTYGGTGMDFGNDIIETVDNGYLIVGNTFSSDGDVSSKIGSTNNDDLWVLKINISGDILWEKCLGGLSTDKGISVVDNNSNGFVIGGFSSSNDFDVSQQNGGGDYWIVEIDSVGVITWEETFGGGTTDRLYSLIKTSDGGYAAIGCTMSSNNGDISGGHGEGDYWIVKTNEVGNMDWQLCLGSWDNEEGFDIAEISDGEYIVVGFTHGYDGQVSANYGNNDYWVVRLTSVDYTELTDLELDGQIHIAPNPVDNEIHLTTPEILEGKYFSIHNVEGKVLSEGNIKSTQTLINVSKLEHGYYYLFIEGTTKNIPFLKQ